jgi:hypothetical protein
LFAETPRPLTSPPACNQSTITSRSIEVVTGRKAAVPYANRLLGLLPRADYQRLLPHLQPVSLEYRQSLYEANKPIGFVYFIETGVGSLVNTMANGQAAEVGTIGSEGMVGLPLVFGDKQTPTSVYIQVPGAGLRMKAALFKRELARSASMRTAMLRYAHAFFNQVAQSAACNHFGIPGHDAGGAADWRHRRREQPATGRPHPLPAGQRHGPRSPWPGTPFM